MTVQSKSSWYRIATRNEKNPEKILTLGRHENKDLALKRLNEIFLKGEPPLESLIEGKELFLKEGDSDGNIFPLIIAGVKNNRVATIGS